MATTNRPLVIGKDELSEMYIGRRMSTVQIASKIGVSPQWVFSLLKRHGIQSRNLVDAASTRDSKNKVNESFFDNWSPEMAWVLGLIITDGNLASGTNVVGFSSKDVDVVRKFSNHIGFSGKLRTETQSGGVHYHIQICNRRFRKSLENLGLTPRKSFSASVPDGIPDECIPHLLRGLWDGDGHIRIKSTSECLFSSYVSASEALAEWVFGVLSDAGVKSSSYRFGRYFRVDVPAKSSHLLCDFIYKNSHESTRMDRKFLVYSNHLDCPFHVLIQKMKADFIPANAIYRVGARQVARRLVDTLDMLRSGKSKSDIATTYRVDRSAIYRDVATLKSIGFSW